MASSSSHPHGHRIAMRAIIYEPNFDETSLKGKQFCDRALNVIKGSSLVVFTRLPQVAYPEIVKEFYQNFILEVDNKKEYRVSITISKERYSFGCNEIATALGITGYKPITYKLSETEMKLQLMKEPKATDELRCSHLHEDFWVVDKFLRIVVCPFMHDNELPQYAYKFWHGLLKKNVIDVPRLVIEMMAQAHHGGRSKKDPHALILPRTITAILKVIGCNVNARAEVEKSFGLFDYKRVKKSLNSLGRQAGLIATRRRPTGASGSGTQMETEEEGHEDDDVIPEHVQEEPPAPAYMGSHFQGPSQSDWDAYTRTQGEWMQGVNTQLQGFGATMGEMNTTVQDLGARMRSVDTRVGHLETRTMLMQRQVENATYDNDQVYMMQRLSLSRAYGDVVANDMFDEAEEYADRRRSRGRQNRARRHRQAQETDDDDPMN